MPKVTVCWSGGKDSCLACYRAMREGHEVTCLVNTVSAEFGRVRFHGVEKTMIQQQAAAIGLPLLQRATFGDTYEDDLKAALAEAIRGGAEAVVFGDLHLEHCREWAERICGELGVQVLEPLWGTAPADVLAELVDAGFEATVVGTQGDVLGREWIGRALDRAFVSDIRAQTGIDPCGENGEYHTLVTDGPVFKRRLEITEAQETMIQGYWFLDIRSYQWVRKCGSALDP